MINKDCKLDLPYPPAVASGRDPALADRLSALYAGRYSELSAITSYLYQHIILKEKYAYLADVIECVSVTEMTHIELLAELIRALGGNPVIAETDRRRQYYWNGSFAVYEQNPERILADNIRAEKRAIADYTALLNNSRDEKVNAVIKSIIKDEELHADLFRSLATELF